MDKATEELAERITAGEPDIQGAIDRSVARDEVVTLAWSQQREDALLAVQEDGADTDRVLEAWGTTEDGDTWRVHLQRGVREGRGE